MCRPKLALDCCRSVFDVATSSSWKRRLTTRTSELSRGEAVTFLWGPRDVRPIENRKPRILVIEDDVLIAMDVEYMVGECGCVPVGPVSNVEAGLLAVRQNDLDGAVLDVNLGGERVWPVADLLHEHGVPFVIATGYSTMEVPERFKQCQVLHKPLTEVALFAALDALGLARR